MSTPSGTSGATTPAAGAGAAAGASTAAAAAALSNKDFRKYLTTPMHPSMAGGAATPIAGAGSKATTTAAAAAGAGGKTPGPGAAASGPAAVKFASNETKTIKFTKSGVADTEAEGGDGGDGGDGDGEGEGDDSAGGGGGRGGKKERVLSSRERSFIQFQQKQALKASSKVKYRDRAKERQQDANPDYVGVGPAVPLDQLSIEASKYLGGDLAHTHLVKGLDFALLNKVREELEKNEEAKLEALVEAQRAAKTAAQPAAAAAAAVPTAATAEGAAKRLTPAQQAALNMSFGSPLAAAIYKLTFDESPATKAAAAASAAASSAVQSDLFLPGRMTFDFPLPPCHIGLVGSQRSANALPTTSLTSRSDLDAFASAWAEEHCTATLPDSLHTKVSEIFSAHRRDVEERKLKRKRRAEEGEEQSGFNVEKTPLAEQHAAAAAAAAAASAAAQNGVSSSSGGQAQPADAPEYTVARPPPDSDSDDDDIFAGAGSDYRAVVDDPMQGPARPPASDDEGEEEAMPEYSVARPPPSPDAGPVAAAAAAGAAPLFARGAEPPVPQLDARASRMRDDSDSDASDDDMFGGISTRAGDEILGGASAGAAGAGAAASGKALSAGEKLKLKNSLYADAEYESLFPEGAAGYSTILDEEDDDDDETAGKKSKLMKEKEKEQAAAAAKGGAGAAGGRGGKTPMHRGGGGGDDDMDSKKREARFNAEYSQVASLLKARGVQLNDDASRRAAKGAAASSNPGDDERAIKRQRILKGFANK